MDSFLTRFEEAALIGLRALDLANGEPPLVDPEGCDDDLRLAEKELRAGKLDFTIRSYMPNGIHEDRQTKYLRQRNSSTYALKSTKEKP